MIFDSILVKVIVSVLASLLVGAILMLSRWYYRKYIDPDIRIVFEIVRGPISTEYGFTETAVKIKIANTINDTVEIQTIQLMFCRDFGFKVASEAHAGFTHPKLPSRLDGQSAEYWYIPAERASNIIRNLKTLERDGTISRSVRVRVRCTLSSGKVFNSRRRDFPTDLTENWI